MVRPRWSGPRAGSAWNSADRAERGRGAECGGDLGLERRIYSTINTLTFQCSGLDGVAWNHKPVSFAPGFLRDLVS